VDFWTNRTESGPKWITLPTPLDTMPLFVKAGSIIPTSEASTQYIGEEEPAALNLLIYPKQGDFETTIHQATKTTTVRCSLSGSQLDFDIRGHSEQTVPCNIVVQNLSELSSMTWNGTELSRRDSESVSNEDGCWYLSDNCVRVSLPAFPPLSI
jgi:alpha-glucosidase (family GH31 glycosyl hydrolase)